MNLRRWSGQWGGVLVAVLGLSACDVGGEARDPLGTSEAALCSVQQTCPGGAPVTCSSATSVCHSSPDNGGWVECDGVRTHCLPSAPACTCGAARYTEFVYGEGMSCGVALNQARARMVDLVASTCPAGSCDAVDLNGECFALGTEYSDGFRVSLTHTFSCLGPANCQ